MAHQGRHGPGHMRRIGPDGVNGFGKRPDRLPVGKHAHQFALAHGGLCAEIGQQSNTGPGQGRFTQRFAVVGRQIARNGHGDALFVVAKLARFKRPCGDFLRPRVMQTVVRLQIGRAVRLALFAQICAAGHQHRFGAAQGPSHMGVGWACGVANGQVKALGRQCTQAVRHVQLDPHLGVVSQKMGQ